MTVAFGPIVAAPMHASGPIHAGDDPRSRRDARGGMPEDALARRPTDDSPETAMAVAGRATSDQ